MALPSPFKDDEENPHGQGGSAITRRIEVRDRSVSILR